MGRLKNLIIAAYRKAIGEYAWARKHGLKAGTGVSVLGGVNFGSEPYLITLGNNVWITGTRFITHDGGTWAFRRQPGHGEVVRFGKIKIGDDTFLGSDSIIMPGVTIGKHCVVGAGSIVTRDVPDYTVVAGVPAKVICTLEEYETKCRAQMPLGFDFDEYNKNKRKYLQKILP